MILQKKYIKNTEAKKTGQQVEQSHKLLLSILAFVHESCYEEWVEINNIIRVVKYEYYE